MLFCVDMFLGFGMVFNRFLNSSSHIGLCLVFCCFLVMVSFDLCFFSVGIMLDYDCALYCFGGTVWSGNVLFWKMSANICNPVIVLQESFGPGNYFFCLSSCSKSIAVCFSGRLKLVWGLEHTLV